MAKLLEVAAVAFWLPGNADLPSVVDQLVRKGNPVILRQNPHQLLLDLLRGVAFGKAQTSCDSENMGVNYNAFGLAKADAKDDVGRFASRAGNGDQLRQSLRNFSVEVSHNLCRRTFC